MNAALLRSSLERRTLEVGWRRALIEHGGEDAVRNVFNSNPEGHNQYTKGSFKQDEDEHQRHNYKSWTHPNGDKVELRTSTVYKKSGNLRDPQGTKNVAVVDLNGKEHKAFSTKGEGYEKRQELSDKVEKHLAKHFGIEHKLVANAYALDQPPGHWVTTEDGYKVVELNAQGDHTGSGYLHDNHFTIDAYTSHLTGREPAHVSFIKDLLTKRKRTENMLTLNQLRRSLEQRTLAVGWRRAIQEHGGEAAMRDIFAANSNPEGHNQYTNKDGSITEKGHDLIRSYGGYTEEKHGKMAQVLSALRVAETPAEAKKVGNKERDRLDEEHPGKPHDGMVDHLVKAVQSDLKSRNVSQRSAEDERADRILRIRDSSGKTRGRSFNSNPEGCNQYKSCDGGEGEGTTKETIAAAKGGDHKALSKIIEDHQDLMHQLARRYAREGSFQHGEYVSEGNLALIKEAVPKFDPTTGSSFGAFARVTAARRMLDLYRKGSKIGHREVPTSGLGKGSLDAEEPDQTRRVPIDVEDKVAKGLSALDDRSKDIMIRHYGLSGQERMSQKDLAAKHGVSVQRMSQLVDQATEKMKEHLTGNAYRAVILNQLLPRVPTLNVYRRRTR